jgi:hypothetical protein
MTFVAFLLALGASLRLTRLAVTDTITQPFRTAIAMRYASASALESQTAQQNSGRAAISRAARRRAIWLWLVQLFECPWCIGFWISAAVAAVAVSPAGTSTPAVVAAAGLSLSYLVGLITLAENWLHGTD